MVTATIESMVDSALVTRILIADDHAVVRSGLRTILDAQPNWEVVAKPADGKEAIHKAIETTPDIAVIDYSLPLVNGIEATRQIRAQLPKRKFSSSPCMTTSPSSRM